MCPLSCADGTYTYKSGLGGWDSWVPYAVSLLAGSASPDRDDVVWSRAAWVESRVGLGLLAPFSMT
jgi:hypothetical protein